MSRWKNSGLNFALLTLVLVPVCYGATMQETIANEPKLSTFHGLIERATTSNPTIWNVVNDASVVFAPLNEAWALAASITDARVDQVVKGHMLSNKPLFNYQRLEQLRDAGGTINSTTENSLATNKVFLFHHEHGIFSVNGANLVTANHTDPPVNEIVVSSNQRLFLVDRPVSDEKPGHKDNFYNHILKDEAKTKIFAELITACKNSGVSDLANFVENVLGSGTGTMFAVTDSALSNPIVKAELEDLKNNKTKLGEICMSTFINKNFVFTRFLHEEIQWQTMGQPLMSHSAPPHNDIKMYVEGGGVKAVLAPENANITMSNGVLHILDRLLHFPYKCYTTVAISTVIGTEYIQAVDSVPNVKTVLKGALKVTLFAPVAAAAHSNQFKELLSQQSTTQDKNNSPLAELLKSGMVSEEITLAQLKTGVDKNTVAGTKLTSEHNGRDVFVTVEGVRARVVGTHVCSNGIVHVVDKVLALRGTTVWDVLNREPLKSQLGTFTQLLKTHKLDGLLANRTARHTVFAPNDTAMADLEATEDGKELLKDEKLLKCILERHIGIGDMYVSNQTKVLVTSPTIRKREMTISDESGRKPQNHNITIQLVGDEAWVRYRYTKGLIVVRNIAEDNGVIQIIDDVLFGTVDVERMACSSCGLQALVSITLLLSVSASFL